MLGHVVLDTKSICSLQSGTTAAMQQVDMPGRTMESIMIIVILTCSRRVLDLD